MVSADGLGPPKPFLHHVRLENRTLQVDMMICQSFELGGQDFLCHLGTVVDVMIAFAVEIQMKIRVVSCEL